MTFEELCIAAEERVSTPEEREHYIELIEEREAQFRKEAKNMEFTQELLNRQYTI